MYALAVWYSVPMSIQIRGRFYFKRTSNGNIIGEFSNRQGDVVSTESADLTGHSTGFVGSYNTTWQEVGKPHYATLTIAPCTRNPALFTVTWFRDRKMIFDGEGMLCDDILIGDYHSV